MCHEVNITLFRTYAQSKRCVNCIHSVAVVSFSALELNGSLAKNACNMGSEASKKARAERN